MSWGGGVCNNVGWGERAAEYLRATESGDIRYTEDLNNRVTQAIDSTGFAEIYNQSWAGQTLLEK